MRRTNLAVWTCLSLITLVTMAACGDDGDADQSASSGDEPESLEGRSLTIGTFGGEWTDAIKKYYTDPFSEETGVTVNFVPAPDDPASLIILQEQQGDVQIDLMDGGNTGQLEMMGLAAHFPEDVKAVLEEHSRPGAVKDYVLENSNVAGVLVCNPDLVEQCPTTAEEFWDVENFPGERALLGSPDYALTFASLAAGASGDPLFPVDIPAAIAKLEEIKDDIKVWPESGTDQIQVMADKEVAMSYMWNGRAHVLKRDYLPNLEVSWEDSIVTVGSGWTVAKSAPNKDVAFAFLEWVAEHQENQAGWTTELTYLTPAKDLLELVEPEIAEALPSAHEPYEMDTFDLAQQASEMQKAWQEFITG